MSGHKDFQISKGRPDERSIDPLAGQVQREMIASGWQTAAPQVVDDEVVTVTKSACPRSLEARLHVPGSPSTAMSAQILRAVKAEALPQRLAPGIVHAASPSRIRFSTLSATVSTA